MPSTTCGHCKAFSHMSYLSSTTIEKSFEVAGGTYRLWMIDGAYLCDACDRVSVVIASINEYPGNSQSTVDSAIESSRSSKHWYPQFVNRPDYDDVDPVIGSAAAEAHACASIGARSAAIIMARAVVEASAKLMSAEGRDLNKKIDWLGDQHLLLPGTVEAAHEVRFFGNDMAHGDFASDITDEDVTEVLGIMDDVIDALFTQPARTQRRAEARAARREK